MTTIAKVDQTNVSALLGRLMAIVKIAALERYCSFPSRRIKKRIEKSTERWEEAELQTVVNVLDDLREELHSTLLTIERVHGICPERSGRRSVFGPEEEAEGPDK